MADQDDLAAEWGLKRFCRAGAVAPKGGPAPSGRRRWCRRRRIWAAQWAAMIEDGRTVSSRPATKGGAEAYPQTRRKSTVLLGFISATITLNEIRASGRSSISAMVPPNERLPDARNHLRNRPSWRLMTTSLRNFTSDNVEVLARPHHLGALSATISIRSPLPAILAVFKGRGVGQFRPVPRSDLQPSSIRSSTCCSSAAADRPAIPHRGPSLHDDSRRPAWSSA